MRSPEIERPELDICPCEVTKLLQRSPTCLVSRRSLGSARNSTGRRRATSPSSGWRPTFARAATRSHSPTGRWDFDLILCRDGGDLERVQVKYARCDGRVILVPARSHSLTNGKVRATKLYTSATIDWLAVWEATLDRCYYIPAAELGVGMRILSLRLTPAANCQVRGVRMAEQYADI
ncbi:MAG: hypothetical protein H0T69_03540 [Thermoleophilaceae bacterium]|nr:hypothetical protein [Thermoleophilaceae bacterium]